jgi:hypothetical protein
MKTYPMYYSEHHKPYVLTEQEAAVLNACSQWSGSRTTNTDIKLAAKLDLPAASIGMIMSRLRAVKLITYQHIETGRMAVGSGRYIVVYLADYFGTVLEGEEQPLP